MLVTLRVAAFIQIISEVEYTNASALLATSDILEKPVNCQKIEITCFQTFLPNALREKHSYFVCSNPV